MVEVINFVLVDNQCDYCSCDSDYDSQAAKV